MISKQIKMEDCVYFIGGNCQEYLDGVCENYKCDIKIIKGLKEALTNIKQILTEGVCKNCSEDSANDCIPECDSHRILEIIKEVEDEIINN